MTRIYRFTVILSCLLGLTTYAGEKPKLVVGLVVDQMSNTYIERFWDKFGEGGFRRMVNEGANFQNAYYEYMPTQTGPGHATIYTGLTPSRHGIAANMWLEGPELKRVYCVEDEDVKGVGSMQKGQCSPKNLKSPALGDMMNLSSGGKAKIVSLALKDRSAVLPAGHSGNVALWWDDQSGKWTSSSHYMKELPQWLTEFEKAHPAESYLKTWAPLSPPENKAYYDFHDQFEEPFKGEVTTSFPYDFNALSKRNELGVLRYSPFGNTYTFDLARAALTGELLGQDEVCDLLSVSLSSTDYIGHRFGPFSQEIEDTYIRLDKELADFIRFLETSVGKDEFVIFLTADHGVMPNAGFLQSQKIPSGQIDYNALKEYLNKNLKSTFGEDSVVKSVINDQVYFDPRRVGHVRKGEVLQRKTLDLLMEYPRIVKVLSAHDLMFKEYHDFPAREMQDGYFPGRSGDIMFVTQPFTGDADYPKGADHGSPYEYDSHVPMLWFGKNVKKGEKVQNRVGVTSIVPTVCEMLKMSPPPACTSPSLLEEIK